VPVRRLTSWEEESTDDGFSRGRACPARFWPQGWGKLVELRIGIVPLPVYVLPAALVTFFILRDGKIASDLPTMIAVLAL
jgi:malate:Na+ symporter